MRRTLLVACSLLGVAACAADESFAPDAALPTDQRTVDLAAADSAGDAGPSPDTAPGRCSPGEPLLARLDPQRMRRDLEFLVGLQERISPAAQAQAAAYLHTELANIPGVTVSDQSYSYEHAQYVNVVAEIAGDAETPVVIGSAHFDSTSWDPTQAPGADDNASGVVALLEVARALAGCHPQRTVLLLFLSNEESGAVGAVEWIRARQAALPPESVAGVLNLDMVGYAADGEDLDLTARPPSQALVADMAPLVPPWSGLAVKPNVAEKFGCGDDVAFALAGYQALCVIAEYTGKAPNPTANPYYHGPEDTLDRLNFAFHTQATRAVLAMVAALANPEE